MEDDFLKTLKWHADLNLEINLFQIGNKNVYQLPLLFTVIFLNIFSHKKLPSRQSFRLRPLVLRKLTTNTMWNSSNSQQIWVGCGHKEYSTKRSWTMRNAFHALLATNFSSFKQFYAKQRTLTKATKYDDTYK